MTANITVKDLLDCIAKEGLSLNARLKVSVCGHRMDVLKHETEQAEYRDKGSTFFILSVDAEQVESIIHARAVAAVCEFANKHVAVNAL